MNTNGSRSTFVSGTTGSKKASPISAKVHSDAFSDSSNPFGAEPERRPFDDYFPSAQSKDIPDPFLKPSLPPRHANGSGPAPNLAPKVGLGPANDGYARAVALYAFKAGHSGDLALSKGDVVVVKDKEGGWGLVEGRQGRWRGRNLSEVLRGGVERTERLERRFEQD